VQFDNSPPALPAAPFVYPIIDTGVCLARGWDPAALADACLRGGARILQLRDKSGSSTAFLALADGIVGRAREFGAALIVNDRADIARMSGAAGVHVGQEDLGVDDVRRIVGRTFVVGASTHDEAQIDRAVSSESTYVAVGPIFETATKETGYSARGLDLVRYASRRGKPVVAIGGITLDRAEPVVKAGAAGLAVITDLLTGDDPEVRTRAFIARLAETASLRAEGPRTP
jgi:thiamine-phosphate diphosphorylase